MASSLTRPISLGRLSNGLLPFRRLSQWLLAAPHPSLVCEISETHLAAARWDSDGRRLEGFGEEQLPPGMVTPSPVEVNCPKPEELAAIVTRVIAKLPLRGEEVALLLPDPVVRVFILPFETFPSRAEDAAPLLRWRLKKSVPFDVEETIVSSMKQTLPDGRLEVVAAVARQRIVREYEGLFAATGLAPGVVLSSTLSALRLLEEGGATLFVRLSGDNLTSVIVKGPNVCVYRSSIMAGGRDTLEPQAMLDELYPAVAYYQDTWGGNVERVRLVGLGNRFTHFSEVLVKELGCSVMPLVVSTDSRPLPEQAHKLVDQGLEAIVGWGLGAEN